MSPFLYSERPGRKLNKNGFVILFESKQKSKFICTERDTRALLTFGKYRFATVRFKRFPRMTFEYYENYKIIRLILITWLVNVSRRHLFAV